MPTWTFAATATAASWCGLQPFLLDVERDSWQLDADALDSALEARGDEVAIVIGCSTFGTVPPLHVRQRWRSACTRAGVPLLVDSAAALGATDEEGLLPGTQGDAEVYSLHATKPFAIGEGGLLVTRDNARDAEFRQLVNFGFNSRRDVAGFPGTNAKMSEIHAATALAVLDNYANVLQSRRATGGEIATALTARGFLRQRGADGSTVQFVPVLAPTPAVREAVLAAATANGVEVRTYYDPPLHALTAYREAPRWGQLTVAEDLARRTLSLPMANDLSAREVALVIETCLGGAAAAAGA